MKGKFLKFLLSIVLFGFLFFDFSAAKNPACAALTCSIIGSGTSVSVSFSGTIDNIQENNISVIVWGPAIQPTNDMTSLPGCHSGPAPDGSSDIVCTKSATYPSDSQVSYTFNKPLADGTLNVQIAADIGTNPNQDAGGFTAVCSAAANVSGGGGGSTPLCDSIAAGQCMSFCTGNYTPATGSCANHPPDERTCCVQTTGSGGLCDSISGGTCTSSCTGNYTPAVGSCANHPPDERTCCVAADQPVTTSPTCYSCPAGTTYIDGNPPTCKIDIGNPDGITGTPQPTSHGSCNGALQICDPNHLEGCVPITSSTNTCPVCPAGTNWDSVAQACMNGTVSVQPSHTTCQQLCYPGCGCNSCSNNYKFTTGRLPCGTNGENCPTSIGTVNTDVGSLINKFLDIFLGIAGGIAIILIIISGYRLMISRGNPESIQTSREQLTAAVVGLLFVIFSLVFLQVIGVDILGIFPK